MSDKIESLRTQARELGIEFDGRWGVKKLESAIAENQAELCSNNSEPEPCELAYVAIHEPQQAEPQQSESVVRNISGCRHYVFHKILAPGERYEITEQDRENKSAMLRIENAVKQGKLEFL